MAVTPRPSAERVELHGLGVDRVTMDDTLAFVDAFVREGGPHHIVTLDSSMCVTARADAELRAIVRAAELVTPDSVGVLWACRRAGHPLPERVSGVDIVDRLCARSAERGHRLYFLGGAPGVAEEAAKRMAARFPGCQVVGARDGYFRPEEEAGVLEAIAQARPDVLCVAMGIPMQEKWIARNRDRLCVPVLIGVGGTLDVASGRVSRAPRWVRRANAEWLYRLLRNPRKLVKALTLPRFAWMTLRAPRARP